MLWKISITKSPLKGSLIGLLATAIAGTACNAACSISDFEIKQADWRFTTEGREIVKLVGEIKSNCSEPVGAQVQAVFRDSAGKIVETREFYPKLSRNLQPGETYAFGDAFFTDDATKTISAVSLKVIGTYFWRREQ